MSKNPLNNIPKDPRKAFEIIFRKLVTLEKKINKGGSGGGSQGPAGQNGTDGVDGADGDSAYEIAVAAGFVGDEAAWLASLVGADGVDGQDGAQGIQGVKGDTGDQGIQGIQGVAGNDGAPGADGAQGIQGIQGIQGDAGTDGADGAQGAQGIQGVAGADGADGTNGFSIQPIMLNCLARSASTIAANQSHNGTHKVAYSAPAVGGSPSWLTLSGDGFSITLTEDGIYELDKNTFIATTAGARSSPSGRIAVGGTVEGARPATGYIRYANGHAESSSHIGGHLVERNGSDLVITIPLGNESAVAATNASMAAGESTLTIKKLT